MRVRGFPITTSITSPNQCKLGRDAAGVSLGERERASHIVLSYAALTQCFANKTPSQKEIARLLLLNPFITSLQREETAEEVNAARERCTWCVYSCETKKCISLFFLLVQSIFNAFSIAKVNFYL